MTDIEASRPDLDGSALDGPALDGSALSAKEQALWLFHGFTDLGVLNVPAAVRVSRPLRSDLLSRAVALLVARHPNLRSTFPSRDGTPVRRILAPDDESARCEPRHVEVTAATLDAELTRFAQPPFDIENEIPLRVGHFVGDPAGEVIGLVIQHIACDAESFAVLIAELGLLYQAVEQGKPVPADLAGEVPRYSEPAASAADLEYWRTQLAGADESPRLLDLGRVGARRNSYTAAQYTTRLSDSAFESVKALGAQFAMTPNILLMTIFSVLLWMSGGGEDMVIGVPVDVRGNEARDAVGYHVNLLAIRVPIGGDQPLRAVARAVRDVFLAGLRHAQAGIDEVFPGSYEVSGSYRYPLLRHMFNYRSARDQLNDGGLVAGGLVAGGLVTEAVEARLDYTRLDLQLTALAMPDGIQLATVYSDELFYAEDIVGLTDRMDLLIRVGAEMPDLTLGELALLAGSAGSAPSVAPAAPAPEVAAVAGPAAGAGSAVDDGSAAEQELFELLVELWREVLRSPDLTADAHFFRSGGTSLRAAQLVARVKSRTGVKLSLRHVFKAPTPRQLARTMVAAGQAG